MNLEIIIVHQVAPYAGAWIETNAKMYCTTELSVAPYAGAWIETLFFLLLRRGESKSLPTRERGLKLARTDIAILQKWSLPTRERGLKLKINNMATKSELRRSLRGSVD